MLPRQKDIDMRKTPGTGSQIAVCVPPRALRRGSSRWFPGRGSTDSSHVLCCTSLIPTVPLSPRLPAKGRWQDLCRRG